MSAPLAVITQVKNAVGDTTAAADAAGPTNAKLAEVIARVGALTAAAGAGSSDPIMGRLKYVTDRVVDLGSYTAARGALLDNLDAAISTRAAPGASMALTTSERTTLLRSTDISAAGQTVGSVSDYLKTIITNISTRSSHTAGDVWTVTTRALTDKDGFALSNAGVDAVWDEVVGSTVTARTVINDLRQRLPSSGTLMTGTYTAPPAASANADAVWDELTSGHVAAGSFGKFLADQLNATVGSRAAPGAAMTLTTQERADLLRGTAINGAAPTAGSVGDLLRSLEDRAISATPTTDSFANRLKRLNDAIGEQSTAADVTVATTKAMMAYVKALLASDASAMAANSIGKRIATNLDAAVTSRSAHSAADVWSVGTRALTDKTGFALSNEGVDAIWDEALSGHVTAGSAGKAMTDAAADASTNKATLGGIATAADPAVTTGKAMMAYVKALLASDASTMAANSIGARIATNLDALVSSRSAHSAADVWSVGTRALTDKTGFALSDAGVDAVWDEATAAHVTAGTFAKLLTDNLNATVGSRLAAASYTAPDNASAAAAAADAATNKATLGGVATAADPVVTTGKAMMAYVKALLASDADAMATNSIGKRVATNLDAAVSGRAPANEARAKKLVLESSSVSRINSAGEQTITSTSYVLLAESALFNVRYGVRVGSWSVDWYRSAGGGNVHFDVRAYDPLSDTEVSIFAGSSNHGTYTIWNGVFHGGVGSALSGQIFNFLGPQMRYRIYGKADSGMTLKIRNMLVSETSIYEERTEAA